MIQRELALVKPLIGVFAGLAVLFSLAGCGGSDEKASEAERPAFGAEPKLMPGFSWDQSDYVVRCRNRAVTVSVDAPTGWRAEVGSRGQRTGSFELRLPMKANRSFTVTFSSEEERKRFHVRCLPGDFPPYRFERFHSGGPDLTMVEISRYAVAFDGEGVPVWWYKAEGAANDAKFLGDGTFSYAPIMGLAARKFQVRNLDGSLRRTLVAHGGLDTDLHDLILMPNGNYMLGSHKYTKGIDTSKFGGPKSAEIDTAQVQEITPSGELVWKWDAWPRIGLEQTGRWWKKVLELGEPFDLNHWNSIEPRGNRVLLSFRHLDGVYEIDRRTGKILWKLGGKRIPQSLEVLDDPRKYPLGGQHDARYMDDGTITLLDNATLLKNSKPRAVRYRIDRERRTATLVDEVTDPEIEFSYGLASANLFESSDWLVGWGVAGPDGIIGGYTPEGEPAYRLTTPGNTSYRANPVLTKSPTIPELRRVMDQVASRATRPAAGS